MTTSHFRIGNDTTKGGHGRGCARQSANHRQPPQDLSRYVGGHSRNTLVRCRDREPRPRSLRDEIR